MARCAAEARTIAITAGNSVQILARSASPSSKELNSLRASPMRHPRSLAWANLRLRSRSHARP